MYPNQSVANNGVHGTQQQQNLGYNGMPQQQQPPPPPQKPQQSQAQQSSKSREKKPFVRIIEQPASKALRFRYECEGRSAGSIPGVNSTPENKTFPTIEVVGYRGKAVVVVSCVTKDPPYRPHPHNLVGKEGCKKGVCTVAINEDTMRTVFSNLGIQCVKKKDIDAALHARDEIRVDPFKTGFEHRCQPSSIDLNSVRLCFQVFIEKDGRYTVPLAPVVSDPIYDKKAMSDLVICRLCSCATTVLGNSQIMLLCEKVAKDDISVRFFEETNGQVTWEAYGDFQQTDVHKQTAIAFRTPKYHRLDIKEPANVFIQLKRPSDGVTSEALPFQFIPLDTDPVNLKRKRLKTSDDTKCFLTQQPQQQLQQQQLLHNPQRHKQNHEHNDGRQTNVSTWNPLLPPIKTEPRETSPQPYGLYRGQADMTPSPQPHSPASVMYNQHNPNLAYNLVPTPAHTPGMGGAHQLTQLTAMPNEANMSPMDVQSGYAPQQQQQQQQPQQTLLHQQQQFQHQIYDGATGWTTNAASPSSIASNTNPFHMHVNNNNQNNHNNNNLRNEYLMPNMMTTSDANAAARAAAQQAWNIPPSNLHNQQQQHFIEQQQQQYLQHSSPNPAAMPEAQNNLQNTTNAAAATTAAESAADDDNENGPTISNLLNFDSRELLHIDSEDQQNIQLDTEDLQISNLSLTA